MKKGIINSLWIVLVVLLASAQTVFGYFTETSYYRLKQVDFDGYNEYYCPISAYCNSALLEV